MKTLTKITSFAVTPDLDAKIDQAAKATEGNRSLAIRKALVLGFTAADRQAALDEIAALGLAAYADDAAREKPLNATAAISEASEGGRRHLAAMNRIAAGGRK